MVILLRLNSDIDSLNEQANEIVLHEYSIIEYWIYYK